MITAGYKVEAPILIMDKTFIVFTVGLLAVGTEGTTLPTQCQPFSSLFLWHTGTGEDSSFFLHRRLLIVSIRQLPDNTDVSIDTFGAVNSLNFNFTKQSGHSIWENTIMSYEPRKPFNKAISVKEVHLAISNHYSRKDQSKAEIVYILVNDKTEINNSDIAFDVLRRKKTFIILSGIQILHKRDIWLKLVTNEHHFVEFYLDEDIKETAGTMLVFSCQDSMFVCDNDMYWRYEKGRCETCTYICSKSCTAAQSDYCTQACPYFRQCEPGKNITKDTNDISEPLHQNIDSVVFNNCGSIVISVGGIIIVSFFVYKMRRPFFRWINSLRRKLTGSFGSIAFSRRSEVNGLEDRTYLFHEDVSTPNEPEYLGYEVSDMDDIDLKVLSQ